MDIGIELKNYIPIIYVKSNITLNKIEASSYVIL